MVPGNRHQARRSRCCARIRAEPICSHLLATMSTVNGTTTNPAVRWKRQLSAGGCRDDTTREHDPEKRDRFSSRPTQNFARRSCSNNNQSAMAIRHKAIALCGGSEVRQSWPSSSQTENSILSSGCAKMRRKADALLSFGTPIERTASESAFKRRTHLFTARCRRPLGPPHYIQHGPRALAIGGRRQGLTRGRTRPRTHKPVGVTRR